MSIHIAVIHTTEPLYGRRMPPSDRDEVRHAILASGDRTMRTVKRFDAGGRKIIVRATEMGSMYHLTVSTGLNDGVLFTGIARDGQPLLITKRDEPDQWWLILSGEEIDLNDALPGFRYDEDVFSCEHDEDYLEERLTGSEAAYERWIAREQVAGDIDAQPDEPPVPLLAPDATPTSWGYCKDVLSPALADLAKRGNGAIPAATILACLQALGHCASGETRELICGLVGDRWSSEMTPFDILGLAPGRYCSPSYAATIAASAWISDELTPTEECVSGLSAAGVEIREIEDNRADAAGKISSWIKRHTQGKFNPLIQLDELVQMLIVSAMYFKDAWDEAFERSDSEDGAFFGEDGARTIRYMRGFRDGPVSRFENCKVASLAMTTGARIVFVLPNRDADLQDMLRNGEAVDAAAAHDANRRCEYEVDWWLPKFDVTGSLGGPGEKLVPGIGEISPGPDFSRITGERPSLFPEWTSEARVKIDEEGIEASGYAMFAVAAGISSFNEPPVIPFILDRPFVFVLVSKTNEPMFIGAIMEPEGY